MDENKAPIVIKLGGSAISHSNRIIDFDYLREFRDLLREHILRGQKFIIVTGGGQTSREYRDLAAEKGNITDKTDLHWIGTAVNTLHATIVRALLGEIAEQEVWKYDDMNKLKEKTFEKPVVLIGGFQAGRSSDWVALQAVKAWGSKELYLLKNVDGVYSADPRKNPDAKFHEKLNWDDYLKIIGNPESHDPGANVPIDVVAAREAKLDKIKFLVLKATDFDNIENAINGENFRGTVIS